MKTIQKTSLKNLRNLRKLMSLASLISLISLTSLHAQVKIGQDAEPKKGTVLELNSNADGYVGGLRLPNVWITDINVIPAGFTENVLNTVEKDSLAGAIIYNTNPGLKNDLNETTGVGVYYWTGAKWVKEIGNAIEPWYKVGTNSPSTLNTDDSYLNAKVVIGSDNTPPMPLYSHPDDIYSPFFSRDTAQLTVHYGDAYINGIIFGAGRFRNPGGGNIAIGENATQGMRNGSGMYNIAIGRDAMKRTTGNTSLWNNIAIGEGALDNTSFTSGLVQNIAIGYNALNSSNPGHYNVAIGSNTLSGMSGIGNNIYIGYDGAGNGRSLGNGNIIIHNSNAHYSHSSEGDYNLVIGNFLYGRNGGERSSARVGIGTKDPTAKLHIYGYHGDNTGFRLEDGSQRTGRVLTSRDDDGNAEWRDLPAPETCCPLKPGAWVLIAEVCDETDVDWEKKKFTSLFDMPTGLVLFRAVAVAEDDKEWTMPRFDMSIMSHGWGTVTSVIIDKNITDGTCGHVLTWTHFVDGQAENAHASTINVPPNDQNTSYQTDIAVSIEWPHGYVGASGALPARGCVQIWAKQLMPICQ
ncbi:MAG: hypothetical protein LBI82_07315 [Dysgonamonadaceae bacterium]|nr:hypothetical protein [Dysgonamonadaceae bacterium]